MAARILVVWSLVLVTLWMGVFGFFNKYFDGADYERARVAKLEEKVRQRDRQLAKATFQFSEYKDAIIASGLKITGKTAWTDPKRSIASVMADSEYKAIPLPPPGGPLFAKAKKIYLSGDYKRSSELLDDFVTKYPDNLSLPEASYLLAESYFLSGQTDRSINTIDFLTNHFPETEFSGYALVRLGKIFEKQDRTDEAVEMYELVIKNFPKSNAAILASHMMKAASP